MPSWLPNAISVLRIALLPAWVVAAEAANRAAEATADPGTPRTWALLVLVAIGLSDVVDGFLARRFHLQSRTGATLDAVADKLAQVVLFTYLALRTGPAFAPIPPWFLGLLIGRDLVLLLGSCAIRLRHGSVPVEHRAHGKAASLLLFGLLLAFCAGLGERLAGPALALAAIVVAGSAGLYVRDGLRHHRRMRGAARPEA